MQNLAWVRPSLAGVLRRSTEATEKTTGFLCGLGWFNGVVVLPQARAEAVQVLIVENSYRFDLVQFWHDIATEETTFWRSSVIFFTI